MGHLANLHSKSISQSINISWPWFLWSGLDFFLNISTSGNIKHNQNAHICTEIWIGRVNNLLCQHTCCSCHTMSMCLPELLLLVKMRQLCATYLEIGNRWFKTLQGMTHTFQLILPSFYDKSKTFFFLALSGPLRSVDNWEILGLIRKDRTKRVRKRVSDQKCLFRHLTNWAVKSCNKTTLIVVCV